MWGMQNKSNVVGAGIGMFSFAAMRRISPRLAALNSGVAGVKMACDLIYRFAAIPSLFVYMKVYRDCQTFMLPIFYSDMISMHYASPFGLKAMEIIGEMRGPGGGNEARLTALINAPAGVATMMAPSPEADPAASPSSSSSSESSFQDSHGIADPYAEYEAAHGASRGDQDTQRELGAHLRSQEAWAVPSREPVADAWGAPSRQVPPGDAWAAPSGQQSTDPWAVPNREQPADPWAAPSREPAPAQWGSTGQESTPSSGAGMWGVPDQQSDGVGRPRTRKTWDEIRAARNE